MATVPSVVVLREEAGAVAPSELIAFCRKPIAGYKVPKAIDLRSEPLPKSGRGKALKREHRAPFWRGQQRGAQPPMRAWARSKRASVVACSWSPMALGALPAKARAWVPSRMMPSL